MNRIAMQIRLARIEELLYDDKTSLCETIHDTVFVKLLLNILPDISRNIMELIVGVEYHTSSEVLLTYKIKSIFDIKEISDVVDIRGHDLFIAPELLGILTGVSIGSLRGMLVIRTLNSAFKNFPLPIINVTELMASLQADIVKPYSYYPLFKFKYE